MLTTVTLEQENTAASLLIKVDNKWVPLAFFDSNTVRSSSLSLVVQAGETIYLKCKSEPFFGAVRTTNGVESGGQVRLHVFGNLEEIDTIGEPEAKRARVF